MKVSSRVYGYVYVVQMEGHPWLKIGHVRLATDLDLSRRVSELQIGCPLPLTMLKAYRCEDPHILEKRVHILLALHWRRGEWFDTTLEAIDVAFQTALTSDPEVFLCKAEQARLATRRQELARAAEVALQRDLQYFHAVGQRPPRLILWQRLRHGLIRAGLVRP